MMEFFYFFYQSRYLRLAFVNDIRHIHKLSANVIIVLDISFYSVATFPPATVHPFISCSIMAVNPRGTTVDSFNVVKDL